MAQVTWVVEPVGCSLFEVLTRDCPTLIGGYKGKREYNPYIIPM